jgi:hypothetical protein
MRQLLKLLFVFLVALSCFVTLRPSSAYAQAGSGSAIGSGSAVVAPPAPAPQPLPQAANVPDPIESPIAALSDFQLAKKTGWPIVVLLLLVMITHGIAFLQTTSIGAWFAVDTRATYIAIGGTAIATAYNTLIAGGTWASAAIAVLGSVTLLKKPQTPPAIATAAAEKLAAKP